MNDLRPDPPTPRVRTRDMARRVAVAITLVVLSGALGACLDSSASPVTPDDRPVRLATATTTTTTATGSSELIAIDLGVGEGRAIGINDVGQVVGIRTDGSGFLWDNGELTSLPFAPVYEGINNAGQVLGERFLWENGVTQPVDAPVGVGSAHALNESGTVIGTYGGAAFIWDGQSTDLGTLGGSTIAHDIDDVGSVVGRSGSRAFVWSQHSGMVDLQLGAGSAAFALNGLGQIVTSEGILGVDGTLQTPIPVGLPFNPFADLPLGRVPAVRFNDAGQVVWLETGCVGQVPRFFDGVAISGPVPTSCEYQPRNGCCLTLTNSGLVSGFIGAGLPDGLTSTGAHRWVLQEGMGQLYEDVEQLQDLIGGFDAVAYTQSEAGMLVGEARAPDGTLHATLWRPLTPVALLDQLISEVGALEVDGALSKSAANRLLAQLNAATGLLNDGRTAPAQRLLNAFIRSVERLIEEDQLDPSIGDAWIAQAESALADVGGGPPV